MAKLVQVRRDEAAEIDLLDQVLRNTREESIGGVMFNRELTFLLSYNWGCSCRDDYASSDTRASTPRFKAAT